MSSSLPVLAWRALGIVRRGVHRLTGGSANGAAMDTLVARLASKTEPITVGFVVCSPAKWSTQTLFEALQDDPGFTPCFYPTLSDAALRKTHEARAADYNTARSFFAEIGPIASDLYDPATDRMAPARTIDADVVFIQQPWGLQDLPRQLHNRCLPAYIHYGYPVIRNDRMQFGLRHFHPFLWTHFAADPIQADAMQASGQPQARHVVVTGHPKLDAYLSPAPARETVTVWPRAQDTHRRRIIFAPHHTLSAGSLNMATFDWSAPAILALVQTHPEIDFILKPHPNLEYEATRAGHNIAEIYARFIAGWHAAPNAGVQTGGDYFDLFRSSDAMLTDSGSFLAEYLPSTQPLIRLTKPGAAPLNASGQALSDAFYEAGDTDSLNQIFTSVIIEENDPLTSAREAARQQILPTKAASADRVMDYLRAALRPVSPKSGSNTGASARARGNKR